MKNIEVHLGQLDDARIVQAVESTFKSMGLSCRMKDTLSKFPGCIHWHFQKGNQPGTLEATFWPQRHRLWLSVQSSRRADWIKEQLPEIQSALYKELSNDR